MSTVSGPTPGVDAGKLILLVSGYWFVWMHFFLMGLAINEMLTVWILT